MGFEETLDVRLLLPWVGSSEPPVIRVWTGGPARIHSLRSAIDLLAVAMMSSLRIASSLTGKGNTDNRRTQASESEGSKLRKLDSYYRKVRRQ